MENIVRCRAILLFSFFSFCGVTFSAEAFHILKNGETLYSISRKYNISLNLLLESNNIKDASKVMAGAKIYIPGSYTVKDGDTIYGIARKFSVSAIDLMKVNDLNEASLIKPGDVLSIPQASIAKSNNKPKKYSLVPPKEEDYKPLDDPRNYSKKEANHRGFGQVVFVQSKSKHIYVYGGLDNITVKPNQELSLNESIGKIGEEVFSGNARLYFIVYEKNQPIDPANAPRGF